VTGPPSFRRGTLLRLDDVPERYARSRRRSL
jgi:hypothetical protein